VAGTLADGRPCYLPACLPAYCLAAADEVRTVFITGFPEDVRERELNNMLRFLPGYEVGGRGGRRLAGGG